MELIKTNPMPDEEIERLSKLWKIGKYREWEIDLHRMKEIEKEVSDAHTHYGPKIMGKKPFGAGGHSLRLDGRNLRAAGRLFCLAPHWTRRSV